LLDRIIKIRNGDRWVNFRIYKCDCCHEDVGESDYAYFGEDTQLCRECAFKKGYFSSEDYLNSIGINLNRIYAGINPKGQIEVWSGKEIPPWERKCDKRSSPEYTQWRTKVFERDNYTCQKCGQRGGNLNAHHIKSYAKHKKLRTVVDNGITLCEVCHKKQHSKRRD
jgi:hypothetical protein